MAAIIIIACIPQDAERIARENGFKFTIDPGIDYTEGECHECGCAVWVGPRQLKQAAMNAGGYRMLCYVCVAGWARHAVIVDLGNPNDGRIRPI